MLKMEVGSEVVREEGREVVREEGRQLGRKEGRLYRDVPNPEISNLL